MPTLEELVQQYEEHAEEREEELAYNAALDEVMNALIEMKKNEPERYKLTNSLGKMVYLWCRAWLEGYGQGTADATK